MGPEFQQVTSNRKKAERSDSNAEDRGPFRESLSSIEPIRMHEPLAVLLGATNDEREIINYTFTDVVKMSGHACPTVATAFVACKHALRNLYPEGPAERGSIKVSVHGEPDEGIHGVMSQVFSYVTGACPETGFKGLYGLHKRKDLLRFVPTEGATGLRFDFSRTDTKDSCRVTINPSSLPALPPSGARRLDELMEKNVWQGATKEERIEFRDLWMQRVIAIAAEERDRPLWLHIEKK